MDRTIAARLGEEVASQGREELQKPLGCRFVIEVLPVGLGVIDPAAQLDSLNTGGSENVAHVFHRQVIEKQISREVAAGNNHRFGEIGNFCGSSDQAMEL